ncbi:MAG: hypothetical protein ACRCXA_07290 [Peptostreptococcaceae bacterium]
MNNNASITKDQLNESIELLSRNLYLESPDLWIDFSDKMNDNNFDEMVVFFAIKYNHPRIVKYVLENNLLNLDAPSRNKTFNSIKEHLLSIANKNKNTDIVNCILGIQNNPQDEVIKSNLDSQENTYIPEYICPNCKCNIFSSGFITTEEITCEFSKELNRIISTPKKTLDFVKCNNCNHVIKDTTLDKLNNLCTIQNCDSCGLNLTSIGITDKAKRIYNKESNKFVSSNLSYHCSSCDKELNKFQIDYFNL